MMWSNWNSCTSPKGMWIHTISLKNNLVWPSNAEQEPMKKRQQSTPYNPGQTPEPVHQMSYTGLACMWWRHCLYEHNNVNIQMRVNDIMWSSGYEWTTASCINMKDSLKKGVQNLSHAYEAQMQAKLNNLLFHVQILLSNKKKQADNFYKFPKLMATFAMGRDGQW